MDKPVISGARAATKVAPSSDRTSRALARLISQKQNPRRTNRREQKTKRRLFEMMHGMKPKEIYSGTRTLMVKALGMLGSSHDGEVLAAARKVEELRKRTGLTWDDLILEAVTTARAA